MEKRAADETSTLESEPPMKQLKSNVTFTAYLMLNGNCSEAIEFYVNAFEAKLIDKYTYEGSPQPCEDNFKNKIMHAELNIRGVKIYMADMKPENYIEGTNVSVSTTYGDLAEAELVFKRLSEGSKKIHVPFDKQFWGQNFGQLTDKFGITWQVSSEN